MMLYSILMQVLHSFCHNIVAMLIDKGKQEIATQTEVDQGGLVLRKWRRTNSNVAATLPVTAPPLILQSGADNDISHYNAVLIHQTLWRNIDYQIQYYFCLGIGLKSNASILAYLDVASCCLWVQDKGGLEEASHFI